MAVTGIGKRYARAIHDPDRHMTLADVPAKHQQDTRDSYIELFSTPLEE